MFTITVCNIRKTKITYGHFLKNGYKFKIGDTWHVYAGRGAGSPLGNPFYIKKDGDRSEVIQKFRRLLWEDLQLADKGTVTPLVSEVRELAVLAETSNIQLYCFCAPLACHCDVIKSCIEWMNDIDF